MNGNYISSVLKFFNSNISCCAVITWQFFWHCDLEIAVGCRFHVVAYLQQIWWFEVDGMVKFRFPAGVYCASFRLHLGRFSKRMGRRSCNFEHTHGWEIKPVRFELSTSDSQQASLECCLENSDKADTYGVSQRGKWIDYEVGEFIVLDSDTETDIKFSMKQIDCTHSKGGLCVDSFTIIPVALKDRGKGKHA